MIASYTDKQSNITRYRYTFLDFAASLGPPPHPSWDYLGDGPMTGSILVPGNKFEFTRTHAAKKVQFDIESNLHSVIAVRASWNTSNSDWVYYYHPINNIHILMDGSLLPTYTFAGEYYIDSHIKNINATFIRIIGTNHIISPVTTNGQPMYYRWHGIIQIIITIYE